MHSRGVVAPPATEAIAKSQASAASLRAIIVYKVVRGSVTALLALLAVVAITTGTGALELGRLAEFCRVHVGYGLGAHLSLWVSAAATPRHLHELAAALSFDGSWTLFEAWALWRSYAWAGWLVVAATALLLPFEAFAVVQQPSVVRVLVLLVNLGIVGLLARRIRLERKRR